MPDLTNSQRRLYKATYAPIHPDPKHERVPGRRAIAKAAFLAALAARPREVENVRRRLADHPGGAAQSGQALAILERMAHDASPTAAYAAAPDLAEIESETLIRIGEALFDERRKVADDVQRAVSQVREAHRAFTASPPSRPGARAPLPTPTTGAQQPVVRMIDGRDALGRPTRISRSSARTPGPVRGTGSGVVVVNAETDIAPVAPAVAAPALARSAADTIEESFAWAARHRLDLLAPLQSIAADYASVPMSYSDASPAAAATHLIPKIVEGVTVVSAALKAFKDHMNVEPVGRLHLERLEMTPIGVERGELVSSVPLTPKETVNISHREWSITTEEYESIVRDFFEGYSETGVAEKTEVAQSTENQTKHSSALSFGASASASYLGVTLSSSFGYSSTSDDAQAQKDSRNQTISATRKASARSKKDHRTSFRTSSVAGTEDRAVRVITNPSDTLSMRVDYYQLMRHWRVDLYRYGLRMTYDIVVPSPGADLIRKIESLAALDAQINTPFEFTLGIEAVTRDNWTDLAAAYDASGQIDGPPSPENSYMSTASVQKTVDDNEKFFTGNVELNVDADYTLTGGTVIVDYFYSEVSDDDYALVFDVMFDQSPMVHTTLFDQYPGSALGGSILGRSGHLSVGYFHRGVVVANISIAYTVTLRDEIYRAWQFRAWSAIRTAAEQKYQASRQALRDQRAAIAADLAPFDALTLRRMELEEIMKSVLRWLFGPSFNVTPADIASILKKMAQNDPLANDALDPSSLTNQQWQRMMEFGEFIKYIHNAIEWENVLYFTYPYFWDRPKNWTIKQFLEHPDALHRTFLRAGSARVVLTIRPGFEQSFAALIENGAFSSLPGDHPYVTIAQEIQNYANTNYPGIPPANPANPPDEATVTAAERGILQATWWEYTPTSALDVQLNTAFPEMA
jgi:hypothetical protein